MHRSLILTGGLVGIASPDTLAVATGAAVVLVALAGLYARRARGKRGRRQCEFGAGLARQLLEREEADRKRVAQAIHDGLGHQLLELNQAVGLARDHPVTEAGLREQLESVSVLAAASLETTRAIAYRLRPFELDQLGLKAAIEALLKELCQGTDLRVFEDLEAVPEDLTPTQQAHFFRLVQEGVINVVRHAHASNLQLEVQREGGRLTIQLDDDGVGFDMASARHGPNRGLGLARMAIHADALGGELEVTSSPGDGTQVRVTIRRPRVQAYSD